ncbi:MAG: hypothetical protein ACM3OC_06050 [Deltaproteobacteria bacterium]
MSKGLNSLEQRINDTDDPQRRHVLACAKDFKTSWVELGRALYMAWKDRLYKKWGYNDFEQYTSKEIGIKKNTSMKLLRSYYFLEKEEPQVLSSYMDESKQDKLPGYETIDLLRQAKEKKTLDGEDYQNFRTAVLEGKDDGEVKKELTQMIRQRKELEPEEAWEQKRTATIKRFLGTLRSLTEELKSAKLVSAQLVKEADDLVKKLEEEVA